MPMLKKPESDPSVEANAHSFDLAMRELESIVAQMEGGQMPLESMLLAYQRGALLVAACKQKLLAVEQQVRVLDGEVLSVFETAQAEFSVGSRG